MGANKFVILQARSKLLSLETMEELHTYLVNFDELKNEKRINVLAREAVLLFRRYPPHSMRHAVHFKHSCIIDAELVGDRWWIPETPARPSVAAVVRARMAASAGWGKVVAPAMLATGAAVAVAVMLGPANNG
jgi:hypothetical protein